MKSAITPNLSIGQAAKLAQVNIQTFRYYERVGLLVPSSRKESGYRVYDSSAVGRVTFIKRAQDLGFTLQEVRDLLELKVGNRKTRQVVRQKAAEKLETVRLKIRELRNLEATLKELIHDCTSGEQSGPCPILQKLEGAG